jgi:L-rhamnonate dehydratase
LLCLVFANSNFREGLDREVGNELFWYNFTGEPNAKDGFIELSDNVPGLGLEINEAELARFEVIE